jgi:hypothetical protein
MSLIMRPFSSSGTAEKRYPIEIARVSWRMRSATGIPTLPRVKSTRFLALEAELKWMFSYKSLFAYG